MHKLFLIIWFCSLCHLCYTQNADDENIIIQNKSEIYEYKTGNDKKVVVEEKSTTTYYCNKFRTNVPVVESFNDNVKIDKVSVYVDGKPNRMIVPEYTYHSVENIFYSDSRICRFMLPLTKKGSVSQAQFQKTYTDPRYFARIWLQNHFPTKSHYVEIIVPRWMKMSVLEKNFSGNITRQVNYDEKKDADVYRYVVENSEAFRHEENAPGASYILPHLLILNQYADIPPAKEVYFPGLDDLYAWYRNLILQTDNDKVMLEAKAREITENCTDDLDKMKAVYAWVQKNIRYLAFEDGLAGFVPDNAQNVLRKHYGDCKGMANLIKCLLEPLGFDARLCWLGTNHIAYDYSIPSMAVDNHMICAVLHEGKYHYLDATSRYLDLGLYPEHIQGRQVLIEAGDTYILERIPTASYLQNTETGSYSVEIDGNSITGHAKNKLCGESKMYFLFGLNSFRKEDKNEALYSYYSRDKANFEMDNIRQTDMDTTVPDMTVDYDFKLKNAVQVFGNDRYIELDFRKQLLFKEIDTVKRKYDYLFPMKGHLVQRIELTVPDGERVAPLPEALLIEREGYRFDLSYEVKDNQVIYTKELILNAPYLPKERFAQWNADLRLLKKKYHEQLVISKEL